MLLLAIQFILVTLIHGKVNVSNLLIIMFKYNIIHFHDRQNIVKIRKGGKLSSGNATTIEYESKIQLKNTCIAFFSHKMYMTCKVSYNTTSFLK